MNTKDFRNLKLAAFSVQRPDLFKKETPGPVNLEESTEIAQHEYQSNPIAEGISEMIENAENALNTTFTAEEIEYSTRFILENIGRVALVEAVEQQVGFELNEEEVVYLFNTVEQLNS